MSDDLQNGSIYSIFSKLYHTRVKLSNKKAELEEEINEKLKEQTILKTILKQREEDNKNINKLIPKDFTFTLSKGSDTYFEVLDISWSNNKNKETVFLYKAKRVYQSYKDENNKMTYLCEIKNNKFCISADDGKEWKGDNLWKSFTDDFQFNCEFKTIEHFFGLTYKPVQARIDKVSDGNIKL